MSSLDIFDTTVPSASRFFTCTSNPGFIVALLIDGNRFSGNSISSFSIVSDVILSFNLFLSLFALDAEFVLSISLIIEFAVSFASIKICFASCFAFAIISFSLLETSKC